MIHFLLTVLLATSPSVTSVHIAATWRGAGSDVANESYTIDVAQNREAVARLVRAIEAEPVTRARATQLLLDPQWLAKNASSQTTGICSAEWRSAIADEFRDPQRAGNALERALNTIVVDDYPSTVVTVRFADGRTIVASSRAARVLMLPWETPHGTTWNPELPRAIAALMPAQSPRRGVLLDANLASAIGTEIRAYAADNLLDAEERCQHKEIAAAIEKRFTIVRAYRGTPSQFSAYLRNDTMPPNLFIDARVEHVAPFLARIDGEIGVARPFALEHPDTTLDLVDDDTTPSEDGAVHLIEHGHPSTPREWTLPRRQ